MKYYDPNNVVLRNWIINLTDFFPRKNLTSAKINHRLSICGFFKKKLSFLKSKKNMSENKNSIQYIRENATLKQKVEFLLQLAEIQQDEVRNALERRRQSREKFYNLTEASIEQDQPVSDQPNIS